MGYYHRNGSLVGNGELLDATEGVLDLRTNQVYGASIYSSVMPTLGLYSHWDFSRLSDPVGTTYTANNTLIPGTSGTNIGASSSTPGITHYTSNSQTTTVDTANSLKCLSMIASTSGGLNDGAYLQSAGDAFPNITSSTFSYTWFSVYSHTGVSGWSRFYRYYLNGYNYDYNHGLWWVNTSLGEVDAINYQANASYNTNSSNTSGRANSTYMHYEAISITGQSYEGVSSSTGNTLVNTSGTFNSLPSYGTQIDANRYFQIRPLGYLGNTNYPGMKACEFAFYDKSFTSTEMGSVLTDLMSKWGTLA